MKPEEDDVAEDDDENIIDLGGEPERETGIFRWMSVIVVLLAISGFFGLAWYAYKNGGDVIDEKDAELIQAELAPVKERPADPGGMAIPNQDKAVYNLMKDKQDNGKVAEHILSAPETPVARNADADTGTWMSDQVKGQLKAMEEQKSTAVLPVAAEGSDTKDAPDAEAPEKPVEKTSKPADAPAATKAEKQPKPEEHPKTEEQPKVVATPVTPVIPKSEEKPVIDEKPKLAPVLPKPVVEAVAVKQQEKPKVVASLPTPAEEKKKAVKAAADTAAPASAPPPSGARAQLGAFRSQAEAEHEWKKISGKFADDISGKNHYIVKADLGAKGVYYRLQLAPFASAKEVEQFCLALVGDGQGCFLARGK